MEGTGLRHTGKAKIIAILTMLGSHDHTYCDTRIKFSNVIMSSLRARDIRTCCRTFDTGTVTIFYKTYVCRDRDLNNRLSACKANALTT